MAVTSYTFSSTEGATRTVRTYTFASAESALKNAIELAGTSAGASTDTADLTIGAPPPAMVRHIIRILTSEGWQDLTPIVGYYSSATHTAGSSISVPQATHGMRATRGLMVAVHNETTGAQEVADVVVDADGDVTVTFVAPAAANSKRVTIIGPVPDA